MYLRKLLFILLLFPLGVFAQDNTAFLQNLINTGGTLTTGSYNITSLSMTHSFNFNGSTLHALSTSGAMLNCTTPGVTVQNVGLNGGNGTYNPSGLSGVAISAANVTLISVNVSNVSAYGIVGGATSNEVINSCSVFNTGNVGISLITNTTAVTGIVVTNCSINRAPQGVGVVQSCLMVRNNAGPGASMTGSIITNNVLTQVSNPTSINGECFEIRNNVNALVDNNSYAGGSIGFSMVGCTNTRSPNGCYSGQSLEAIEMVNDNNSSAGTGTCSISSGVVGVLVDGNTPMSNDTITKSQMTSLTSFPILVNPSGPPSQTIAQAQSTIVSLFINNVTATSVTNAVRLHYAGNITANNNVFSGNNTTCAWFFDTALGNVTDNNSTYSGFNTWGCSFASTPTTINNILTNNASPTGPFLSLSAGANVVLGSNIHFNPVVVTPPNISYVTPQVYTQGVPITPLTPTNSGGAATSWSVSPALPSGLVLNTSTGVVSGTPSAITATAGYVITATNSAGSSPFTLTLTVNAVKPNITYVPVSQTYTQFTTIPTWVPTNSGGATSNFTITPTLPTGLAFNTSNGAITGTPTVVSGLTTYKVKCSNTGGADSVNIQITVNVALPVISYSPYSNTYLSGVAITPLVPTSTGGAVASWSVTPSLPASLSLNTSTGVIGGTTGGSSPSTVYTVTATNASGFGRAQIAIQINPIAPNISYSPDTLSLPQFFPVAPVVPINTGGQVAGYTISPAPSTGLIFDTTTGILYGTPILAQPQTTYTIVGSNVSGSSTAHLVITVTPNALPVIDIRGKHGVIVY